MVVSVSARLQRRPSNLIFPVMIIEPVCNAFGRKETLLESTTVTTTPRGLPPLDTSIPSRTETALFALG